MTNTIKNYEVTLHLMLDAYRDFDSENPQVKILECIVCANSEEEARRIAIELYKPKLPIWESSIYEI